MLEVSALQTQGFSYLVSFSIPDMNDLSLIGSRERLNRDESFYSRCESHERLIEMRINLSKHIPAKTTKKERKK